MSARRRESLLMLLPLALVIVVCVAANASQAERTEVLPADGGEPGRAFIRLQDAFRTADRGAASEVLDPALWHLEDKPGTWFKRLYEQMADFSISGGRRQGDRATLFLVNKEPFYATINATLVSGRWRFDTPVAGGSGFGAAGRDCRSMPSRFPCGASSAPDAQVSGSVQSQRIDPETGAPVRPVALIDGLAVRMLEGEAGLLKSIWVVLSGTGLNPRMVSLSWEPDQVRSWLQYPVLTLEVTPDGKSAKGTYYDGISPKEFEVTGGLSIDRSVRNRIRGRLKTAAQGVALFDVAFDIGTASDCLAGTYQCGE
jgi:hypothetical protein